MSEILLVKILTAQFSLELRLEVTSLPGAWVCACAWMPGGRARPQRREHDATTGVTPPDIPERHMSPGLGGLINKM